MSKIDEKALQHVLLFSNKENHDYVRNVISSYEATKESEQPDEKPTLAGEYDDYVKWLIDQADMADKGMKQNAQWPDSFDSGHYQAQWQSFTDAKVRFESTFKRESGVIYNAVIPASGWQPIETAPKDGTVILAIVEPNPRKWWHHVIHYLPHDAEDRRSGQWYDGSMPLVGKATRWMFIPEEK